MNRDILKDPLLTPWCTYEFLQLAPQVDHRFYHTTHALGAVETYGPNTKSQSPKQQANSSKLTSSPHEKKNTYPKKQNFHGFEDKRLEAQGL